MHTRNVNSSQITDEFNVIALFFLGFGERDKLCKWFLLSCHLFSFFFSFYFSFFHLMSVWIRMKCMFCVLCFIVFFPPARVSTLGDKSTVHTLLSTVHTLFSTVHGLKNIKNRSHSTIHTFKNYFSTIFSVFSF